MAKGHRCFSINGFSLHANTATNTLARDSLRKLVEYISRGPLSNERLELTKSGLVKLKLKTTYSDGTSHLIFTPEEFIEKLSAIIPPPKSHLVKWSGVFAPNSPCRKKWFYGAKSNIFNKLTLNIRSKYFKLVQSGARDAIVRAKYLIAKMRESIYDRNMLSLLKTA